MGKTMPTRRVIRVRYNPVKDTYKVILNDKTFKVTRWEVYSGDGELIAVGRHAKMLYDALSYHNAPAVFSYLQTLLYIMNL
jgi:hypothetical protein